MSVRIPFNRASLFGQEINYIQQAMQSGHISGDGVFTKKCHSFLERGLGVPKALLTTSCTHALEMAALLLDVHDGDEVILPSFTFVSTVNAFILRGARPVFVDIRPDTLNLDERLIEANITERTKAIVVVHYAGVGCEMSAILSIAAQYHIPVVEDNAHGLFGKYEGQYLGTFGCLSAQSFHETKNFTSGEGGALLINDERFLERAEILREKGTNRSRFFRGLVDKYTWVDVGSSYLPSELLAAFLFAQFEARDQIQTRRKEIWEYYQQNLQGWAARNAVQTPVVPENREQSYHMYYLLLPSLDYRQQLLEVLQAQGIWAVFHYLPLHLSPMGQKFGGRPGDCPVTERVSDRLVRLPFFYSITEQEQNEVIQAVLAFAP